MPNSRLLQLRKAKGITQAEIAAYLKITPQAYSLYETKKNNINNDTLCMLADYFNVSVDYLLGREERLPSYLSEEERRLIRRYRTVDRRGQESVLAALHHEYTRNKGGKPAADRNAPWRTAPEELIQSKGKT